MVTVKKLNNKGFTLVEVMVAFAILTVAILLITTMFLTATRIAGQGTDIKNQGNATYAAADGNWNFEGVTVTAFDKKATLKMKGVTYEVKGKYGEYKSDEREGVNTYIFRPDGDIYIPPVEEDIIPPNVGTEETEPYEGEFVTGTVYRVGDYVSVEGVHYKVMDIKQMGQDSWKPTNTEARAFKKIELRHDPYSVYELNDVVKYNERYYRAKYNGIIGHMEFVLNRWEQVVPSADRNSWIKA